MAKVELKKPIVEEISAVIQDAQSVVLVDHRGLTVEQDTELRKQLREAGITYKVYKNTMMNFAFKGTDFEALIPYLEGPSALAVSKEDATAPARVLCKFAKTANALEVKGGVVEGTLYDAKGIENVSKIPSREELLSRLLGSMQSPVANLARVLNQIAEKGGAPVKKGRFVIATVQGDIHDIGKNLVVLMLKNYGYEVIDLGKDVESQKILDTAKKEKASVIGLSALMTTTMTEMKHLVEMAKEQDCEAKIIIGGAVVTESYAQEIGADGYSKDAREAVKLVNRLLGHEM